MMKQYLIILVACMLSLHTVAQQYGSFKDSRDGKVYKTVKIGGQEWMAENLNVSKFRNGEYISDAYDEASWIVTNNSWGFPDGITRPAWAFYDFEPNYQSKFGRVYNWYAVNDSRGLAPLGWRIPSYADWKQLINYLGGTELAIKMLKSPTGWKKGNMGRNSFTGNGNNKSGFAAVPGGSCVVRGQFAGIGIWTAFWSSSVHQVDVEEKVWVLSIMRGVELGDKGEGYYIRCIKN